MNELKCPKCEDSVLREPSSGTRVLRCYECGGMWLLPSEAEQLALAGTLLDPESMLPTKAGSTDARTGFCPKGHGIMIRARVDVEEAFYLEQCPHCMGIWFDDGEWHKLASTHLVRHIRDLWDPSWQRSMRTQRAEERYRQRLVEGASEDVVSSLERLADQIKRHPLRAELIAYLSDRSE